jgi:hypothetical protein
MILFLLTIVTLMAALASTALTAVVEAQTAETLTTTIIGNSSTTNTALPGINPSQQPVLQEQTRAASATPINFAHMSITYTGNGTLTIPNGNVNTTVNFTSNGSALVSFLTQSAQGTETIRTEDGSTATLTFYEITKFNPGTLEGEGIIIAKISTDPRGRLAPLNGLILAGIDEIHQNGPSNVTLWEWKSRIGDLLTIPVQDDQIFSKKDNDSFEYY